MLAFARSLHWEFSETRGTSTPNSSREAVSVHDHGASTCVKLSELTWPKAASCSWHIIPSHHTAAVGLWIFLFLFNLIIIVLVLCLRQCYFSCGKMNTPAQLETSTKAGCNSTRQKTATHVADPEVLKPF